MSNRYRLRIAVSALLGSLLIASTTTMPASAADGATSLAVNFQLQNTVTPTGYKSDYGQAFDQSRGFGWTDTAGVPVSLVGNGRERGVAADKRLDTFVSMQLPGMAPGVHTEGAWKAAIANGSYSVTVAAGDPGYTDSHHVVRVEGQVALDFIPTGTALSQTNSVTVNVIDGFLNLDATGGTNTKINYVDITSVSATSLRVTSVTPANGASAVTTAAAVTVQLSNGVLASSVGSSSLQLLDPNGNQVVGHYNVDGAYSNATFVPSKPLATNTNYIVKTTTDLKDPSGAAYGPFTSSFTTGTSGVDQAPVSFTKTVLNQVNGPTTMTIGPDNSLYVATLNGDILKYALDANGKAVGAPAHISTFLYSRIITSLEFDPSSTPTNLKLWVSHGYLCDGDCANFTGTVSVLSGANLATKRDVITGLPRSIGNHMNNGIEFGPDGKLYISQGANNGYGDPDAIWGNRGEDPLTAAVLVADVNRDTRFQSAVNVDTSKGYNVNAADAAVKLYATGVRNAFSLLWSTNGKLYTGGNESANGNSPAGPNKVPVALRDLPAYNDYFTEIKAGKYYGHPNPTRGEFALNGANPTAGVDPFEVTAYPVGTQPDADYQAPDLNLGIHRSPNGLAEYTANTFNGALKNQILMTEYAQGKDVVAVQFDASGKPSGTKQVASGFYNPMGIATTASGHIYVAEFGQDPTGEAGQVTLLTPVGGTTTPTDPTTPPPANGSTVAKVNFGAQSTTAPTGYTADFGEAYSDARGFGWQDSAGAPKSFVSNGRERTSNADKRLNTFLHMQLRNNGSAGILGDARWELKVANGTYDVTVAAGDPDYGDSTHVVRAEGQVVLNFAPTDGIRNKTVTTSVVVNDGKLTIDSVGGDNTKINYIDVTSANVIVTPPPATNLVAKVNFSPQDFRGSDDYSLDYGQPFDVNRGYGWQDVNGNPLSLVGNARTRTSSADPRLNTFIHMQLRNNGAAGVVTPGRWELTVPNGTYKVNIAAGDPDYTDSRHVLRAEGNVVLDHTPTVDARNKAVSVDVVVADGRLTIDAIGGDNTKINYIDVFTADGTLVPVDTTAPTASVNLSGTVNAEGAYVGGASVTINASDASGVKNITYTLDGGTSTAYNGVFSVTAVGSHTVVATATDKADNTKTVTKTFSVAAPVSTGTPVISVTAADDYALNGTRLVFSTIGWETRAPKVVSIKNNGQSALTITNLAFSGTHAGAFKLDTTQPKRFSIAAGATVRINVTFTPTELMNNNATLTISSDDSAKPVTTVALGGLNPAAYEDKWEPSVQQISDAFGFTTKLGVVGTQYEPNYIGETTAPAGEEISALNFTRLDSTKPANLYPMAHYSGRSGSSAGPFGWYAKGSTSRHNLFYFPGGTDVSGGENQRLTPKIGADGFNSFSPTGAFGLHNNQTLSDSTLNGFETHNWRTYPAKDSAGKVIAGAYVIAVDLSLKGGQYKNWDYQDYMFLLTNAKPSNEAPVVNPIPGDAALNLDFSAAKAGTVVDSTGKGTGFTSVQANGAGNQLDASKLTLDTTAGRLKVVSTAGSNSNGTDTQQNALQMAFNGTSAFNVKSRLIGPFTNLTAGNQQEAIFFGPDNNNHAKVEVEYAAGTGVTLTYWVEQNGTGAIAKRIAMPKPTAGTLDLQLVADPATRAVTAFYRIDSSTAAYTQLATTTVAASWFSKDSRAGIITSHAGSTTAITALYDDFIIAK